MRKRYRLVIEPRLKGGPAMTDREKESCEGDFVPYEIPRCRVGER